MAEADSPDGETAFQTDWIIAASAFTLATGWYARRLSRRRRRAVSGQEAVDFCDPAVTELDELGQRQALDYFLFGDQWSDVRGRCPRTKITREPQLLSP
jgi:hypothetical protein